VICLLEDDDIFYHSKLKTISDIYEKHPEIDFAVNGYNIIDRENNTVEKSSFRLAERVFQSNFPFTVDVIKNCNTSELNLIRVNFNASRYSLRKRVGEQLIESLMNIESNMDLMITLHCILSKLIIASIPANLNGYRIHENNVSLRTNILKLDIPFLINNRLKIKNSLNLFIAKNKIINHNFLSYAMLNCANLEFEYSMMMLDRSLIFKNFKLYLYKSKNVKFGGSFYGMFTHNKTRYVMKLLFLPLFIFFPRLARVLYVRIYA
jgi:hypothetical protein